MSIYLSNFQSIVRAWNLQMQKNKNIGLTHPKQNTAQKQSPTNTYYSVLLCELMMDFTLKRTKTNNLFM